MITENPIRINPDDKIMLTLKDKYLMSDENYRKTPTLLWMLFISLSSEYIVFGIA